MGARSSRKQCKQCLLINLTLFVCAYHICVMPNTCRTPKMAGGAWAALEAISAAYHCWPMFPANGASQGAGWVVREVYVGIVL
jgi:hypothetical protein